MEKSCVTRGTGLIEPWLSDHRARKANELIPRHLRDGRILDIGCGSYPYFSHTRISIKNLVSNNLPRKISIMTLYGMS